VVPRPQRERVLQLRLRLGQEGVSGRPEGWCPVTQTERITQMIEMGHFDFFGLGTDTRAALNALDAAARIDLADTKGRPMTTPDFPDTLPAADADDPAKWWRVLDDTGTAQDYSVLADARRAMYDAPGSSAVYGRTRSGVWRLDETLLRG